MNRQRKDTLKRCLLSLSFFSSKEFPTMEMRVNGLIWISCWSIDCVVGSIWLKSHRMACCDWDATMKWASTNIPITAKETKSKAKQTNTVWYAMIWIQSTGIKNDMVFNFNIKIMYAPHLHPHTAYLSYSRFGISHRQWSALVFIVFFNTIPFDIDCAFTNPFFVLRNVSGTNLYGKHKIKSTKHILSMPLSCLCISLHVQHDKFVWCA